MASLQIKLLLATLPPVTDVLSKQGDGYKVSEIFTNSDEYPNPLFDMDCHIPHSFVTEKILVCDPNFVLTSDELFEVGHRIRTFEDALPGVKVALALMGEFDGPSIDEFGDQILQNWIQNDQKGIVLLYSYVHDFLDIVWAKPLSIRRPEAGQLMSQAQRLPLAEGINLVIDELSKMLQRSRIPSYTLIQRAVVAFSAGVAGAITVIAIFMFLGVEKQTLQDKRQVKFDSHVNRIRAMLSSQSLDKLYCPLTLVYDPPSYAVGSSGVHMDSRAVKNLAIDLKHDPIAEEQLKYKLGVRLYMYTLASLFSDFLTKEQADEWAALGVLNSQ